MDHNAAVVARRALAGNPDVAFGTSRTTLRSLLPSLIGASLLASSFVAPAGLRSNADASGAEAAQPVFKGAEQLLTARAGSGGCHRYPKARLGWPPMRSLLAAPLLLPAPSRSSVPHN